MRRASLTGFVVFAVALGSSPAVARADDGDDTLRRYLAGADVVLDATVETLGGTIYREVGVAHRTSNVRVHAVVKGDLRATKDPLRVEIVRFEMEKADALPYLADGARVVLFLKTRKAGEVPALTTADMWFGVQPYGPWLVRRLIALQGPPAPARRVEWVLVAQASSRDAAALVTVFAVLDREKIESIGIGNAGADSVSVPKADADRARRALRAALASDDAVRAQRESEERGTEPPAAWRFRVIEGE